MSVNKYAPHVLVLPEDDANTQIANGFQLALPGQNFRKLQILPEAGGWTRVRDSFLSDHVAEMERNPNRYMVLIIDLDGRPERPQSIHDLIPPTLADKVFIVGAARTPEELKDLGSYETIGRALAEDCAQSNRNCKDARTPVSDPLRHRWVSWNSLSGNRRIGSHFLI
jgi:hypothetical protein